MSREHFVGSGWPRFATPAALVAICAATAGVGANRDREPQERRVFRSDVQTVIVHATARRADGRFVSDLPQDAFEILDDGRPVSITHFSPEPQPLRVAVMLDASWSAGALTGSLTAALRAFVGAFRPEDRARIGTFGAEIAVGANLTSDPDEVERVLREEYWTATGVGTPLWQAAGEALAAVSSEEGRRVVLVFTDGHDSGTLPGWDGSRAGVEREFARQSGTIYIVRPPPRGSVRPFPAAAIAFADRTGGAYYAIPEGANIEATFAQVAEELRHQYLLGFTPAALDGREHEIDVRVNRPDIQIRARRSYVAGSPER